MDQTCPFDAELDTTKVRGSSSGHKMSVDTQGSSLSCARAQAAEGELLHCLPAVARKTVIYGTKKTNSARNSRLYPYTLRLS
jgi:hypothetical protein